MITRTEFTFGNCFGPIGRVVARASELGYTKAAICDVGTWGHVPFFKAAEKAGIQPILGAELLVGDEERSIKVLAKNQEGLRELYRHSAGITYDTEFSDNLLVFPFTAEIERVKAQDMVVDLHPLNPLKNKINIEVARAKSLPLFFVSDVRYPAPTDRKYAELLGVRLGAHSQHWWSQCEIDEIHPVSVSWEEIAERFEPVTLPVAKNMVVEGDLEAEARKGISWRFPKGFGEEYEARLQRELGVIREKQFESYFLMVYDLMRWARERMLVGPGRGSSSGSIICYLLGITELDPIEHGLLFERFVDVTRIDLPDIDMDFPGDRRDELFTYLKETYGETNIARLGNVNKLKPKSILANVGKRMKIPVWETAEIRDNMIERSSGDSRAAFCLEDTMGALKAGRELLEKHPGFRNAGALEGHASHAGVHAAGVIICNTPVADYCSVTAEGIGQIDKYQAESLNLMKLDALGLKTLDIVQETLDEVGKKITDIDVHDPKIYDLLNSQKITGVFQLEGDAARQLLRQFQVKNFNDIVALTSLARPGPLQSGGAKKFLDVRRGLDVPLYHHDIHKKWTEQTEGVVIYQEQILFLGRDIGLLGWPELTALRRAMSKSLGKEYFDQFRDKFLDGAEQQNINKESALEVWNSMMHAGSYAFVKAHAAAYSVISAWTAWLKYYHPLQFSAASLRHTSDDDAVLKLLREITAEGFKYVAFDKDRSEASWAAKGDAIYGGLTAVHGIGPKMAQKVLDSRVTKKDLPPSITAKLENPRLKWPDPYPFTARFGEWYANPRKYGLKEGWEFTKCNDLEADGSERVLIGVLTEKNLRDALETGNVMKRGGVITDYDRQFRYWLNVTIKDDTGLAIATVRRKDYEKMGKEILEAVPIGAVLLIRGRMGGNGIRMLQIEKWKVVSDGS
jgi:DNA polymerase III alpha subunit